MFFLSSRDRRRASGRCTAPVVLLACTLLPLAGGALAASKSTVRAAPLPPPPSIELETKLPGGLAIRGQVDLSLVELRDRLRRLSAESLPVGDEVQEGVPIDSDFSIPLDRPAAIEARIPLLAVEVQQLAAQLGELQSRAEALLRPAPKPRPAELSAESPIEGSETPPEEAGTIAAPLAQQQSVPVAPAQSETPPPELPAELASEILTTEVRLEVARARSAYLRGLSSRLAAVPELARTALIALGAPRTSLRARRSQSEDLATALRAASSRLSRLATRLEAGGLVGFLVEARELANTIRDQARSLSKASEELASRATSLQSLADTLEADGASVRSLYLRAAAIPAASAAVDRRFDLLLQDRRQLRRRVRDVPGSSSDLAALLGGAESLVQRPSSLGTTAEARAASDQAIALRTALDDALARDALGVEQWRLAWVNDAVALLATRISEEERAQAYALSSEMISDLRSEAFVAWSRARDVWRRIMEPTPDLREILTSDQVRDWLERILLMLVAVLAGVAIRRRTGRAAVTAVRRLASWGPMRPHLGTLVRWTGLLQTVVPVAVLYPIYLVVDVLLPPGSFVAEVLRAVFVPFFLYALLRQILIGATRQITRGRPALIPVEIETRNRLLMTYGRLGLVFAWAAAIDSVAVLVVGPGRIVSLVDALAVVWIGIWAGWATIAWRTTLAQEWRALASGDERPVEIRVASWMGESQLGFLLSPLAVTRIAATYSAKALAGHLSGTTLASRLRAMFLRRRSRQVDDSDAARARKPEIPEDYLAEFPLYPLLGETDAVLVPREDLISSILQQIESWQESRATGSAVLVGQKGIGKTTLAAMVSRRVGETQLITHTLRGTLLTESDFVRVMAPALGYPQAKNVEELAQALSSGPERIVVLDEAHSVFLRIVGGYRAYDALVSLVNTTTDKVFWLLVFNRYTWSFLNESRSRIHYFRRAIELPEWTSAEIQDLIRRRTSRAGYKLTFSEVLRTDDIGSSGEIDLIDGSDAYFRLLWESSGGNPRIATRLWLDSLKPIGDKQLEVGLFAEGIPKILTELGDELVFALAAIAQRENLSAQELAQSVNLPLGFAQFAVRLLAEHGLVEPKEKGSDRVTLAPRNYHSVLRILRNRHLLLE